jgi:predicted ribosome quality control (RQC) complex YloA/Tae2 family protein
MKKEIVYFPQININIEYSIGKNDKDNFTIIDNSKPNDMWFHLDEHPSCHVIASLPEIIDKKEMKYIVKKGALLCKENSKYKSEKDLPVIYTNIKNIIKTEKIGTVITSNTKLIKI